MGKVREIIETAKSYGQDFIAITDHGSTSGLYEAQKIGDELGVKVILGCEFYYERENDGENGHLLILAMDNVGLRNIFKMQEFAYVHNFYKKPRINWDVLKEHNEGLIVTSACLGSPFNQYIINGDIQGAIDWARKFKDVFGDRFYIEIQPNNIPEQHLANTHSIRIANQLGIDIVATNDVHYTFETDHFPHEVMLAMQTKKKMSDEKRFRFDVNDFWLKTTEEMIETFDQLPRDVVETALHNTSKIAERCNARIEKGNFLPTYYDVPEGKTERQLLVERVIKGAKEKGFSTNKEYMQAVQEEINVIDRNGYSGYFLVVADYVSSARRKGIIVGDGRGSGAGSKVAYLTDITRIEPSKYDLLFERFMADGRQPDFDVDFSDQDAVFKDLQSKYGVENVARIITFGKMTPKAVVRKVFNTFDHPMSLQNEISNLISDDCKTLEEAFEAEPKLQDYASKYRVEFDVIKRLEGVNSHEGKHAGGVIIYPNLSSHLPVNYNDGQRVVAWDKYMLEELGHYKFDILGLEYLPIVRRTLDSIKETTGVELDLHHINYDDPNVYQMLSKGDVSGVFQISAQAGKVMEQQPRNFLDLIAINALIRPGTGDWEEYIARRKGKEWFKDPNRPWMHETMGTMTYQEQFLLDCHHLAGWSIAYADKHVRKGKNLSSNRELAEKFLSDGVSRGYNKDYLQEVWEEICNSVGDYSFNKSHSASYAMLSYQTAWLKHYYPTHFYASLMSSAKTDGDGQIEIAKYMAECKEKGIQIIPPDINHSSDTFRVVGDSIAYRITTIKHVGDSAIEAIKSIRPIQSFDDFMARRQKSAIKQNVLVNLIKAGCFDEFNPNRAELLWLVDMSNRTKTQIKNDYTCPKYEWNDHIKAEWEKEVLGMYLSSHPMEKYGFKPFDSYKDNDDALIGGQVTDIVVRKDKKGNDMAFLTIDTLYGSIRSLVFSSLWARKEIQDPLQLNNFVMIKGKKSGDSVLLNSVEVLE